MDGDVLQRKPLLYGISKAMFQSNTYNVNTLRYMLIWVTSERVGLKLAKVHTLYMLIPFTLYAESVLSSYKL